jgi:hypothetical protein
VFVNISSAYFFGRKFMEPGMSDEREGRDLVEADGAGRRKRGAYSVGPKLRVAIEVMACGRARTIQEAAALSGMTREAVSKALRRDGVRQYLRQVIQETLGVGATRAARRMVELIESENAMAGVAASKFLLGTGAGVVMPQPAGATVNIAIGDRAGWTIDLTEPGSDRRELVGWTGQPSAAPAGPVIEGELAAPAVDVESGRR